jgi:hypothetical protein
MKDFYENKILKLTDAKASIDALKHTGMMPSGLHKTLSETLNENIEHTEHILEEHVLKANKGSFH